MNTNNNIKLRNKRLSDARNDYTWRSDPLLAELDAATALDITFSQYLSDYTVELCYPSPNRREFAVETSEGRHIGNCVYYNIDEAEGKAELGIMIGDRSCWNKGYGPDAINLLLDHIFRTTSLECVYLNTLDWNTTAQRCFQKCGFKESGHLLRDGHSFVVMEIHRQDWQCQEAETQDKSTVRETSTVRCTGLTLSHKPGTDEGK